MHSLKNIIVLIDFSVESVDALKKACVLAKKFNIKVSTLHIFSPNSATTHPKEIINERVNDVTHEQLTETIIDKKKALQDTLESLMLNELPEFLFGKAYVLNELIEEAEDTESVITGYDLAVIGSSESRSLLEYISGNEVLKAIRSTEIPLITTSVSDSGLEFKNILLSSDLGTTLPYKLIVLCKFFQEQGAKLHIASIITTGLITVEEVSEKIKSYAHSCGFLDYTEHILNNHSELDGLNKLIEEENIDLLLMKTYEKSDFSSVLIGSLAEDAVYKTDVPVIIEKVK